MESIFLPASSAAHPPYDVTHITVLFFCQAKASSYKVPALPPAVMIISAELIIIIFRVIPIPVGMLISI
ncbi:MAG: hypothetical protein PHR81_02950 [Bacteroidales bacterium]|jgi:hypothetical protein|nr:hypothetical protein [Bacteroidales bacterium]MDD4213747.1 hypothetical protein [Bacteroidales bacterium]